MPNHFEIHGQMYKLWPGQFQTDARTYTELKFVTTDTLTPSGLDKNGHLHISDGNFFLVKLT